MPLAEGGAAAGVLWAHADVSERREQHRLLALRNRALNAVSKQKTHAALHVLRVSKQVFFLGARRCG